jgi:CO dehydrogenase nickel-insertion accessory protein CooC1
MKIVITGYAGEGKSTIAQLIKNALQNVLIRATVEDIDVDPKKGLPNYSERLSIIAKSNPQVVIETQQLAREPSKPVAAEKPQPKKPASSKRRQIKSEDAS